MEWNITQKLNLFFNCLLNSYINEFKNHVVSSFASQPCKIQNHDDVIQICWQKAKQQQQQANSQKYRKVHNNSH